MNKPVFYILLGLWLCVSFQFPVRAQENLVPNGSFEEYDSCLQGPMIDQLNNWFAPTLGTPDIYNSCNDESSNYGVPINGFGYVDAVDGQGYIGIVVYGIREYVGIRLTKQLEIGKIYKLSFNYCIPQNNAYTVNNISAGFDSDSLIQNDYNLLSLNRVEITTKQVDIDLGSWYKLSSIFMADASEKYLYIGNFKDDYETEFLLQNPTANPGEIHCFIDDVILTELNIEIPNIFTPNNDGINDIIFVQSELSFLKVEVFNRWGNVICSTNFIDGWDGKNQGKDAPEGVYFYAIITEQNEIFKTGFFHLMR